MRCWENPGLEAPHRTLPKFRPEGWPGGAGMRVRGFLWGRKTTDSRALRVSFVCDHAWRHGKEAQEAGVMRGPWSQAACI